MRRRKDLTNFKHSKGMLTAVSFSHVDQRHQAIWDCLCDCGQKTKVATYYLTSNRISSCGCLRREGLRARGVLHTAFGKTKTLRQWAEDPRCKVNLPTLKRRTRIGWAVERAMTTPPIRVSTQKPDPECAPIPQRRIPLKELLRRK